MTISLATPLKLGPTAIVIISTVCARPFRAYTAAQDH